MFGVHKLKFEDFKKEIYQVFSSGYDNAYEKIHCQKGFKRHGEI